MQHSYVLKNCKVLLETGRAVQGPQQCPRETLCRAKNGAGSIRERRLLSTQAVQSFSYPNRLRSPIMQSSHPALSKNSFKVKNDKKEVSPRVSSPFIKCMNLIFLLALRSLTHQKSSMLSNSPRQRQSVPIGTKRFMVKYNSILHVNFGKLKFAWNVEFAKVGLRSSTRNLVA